MIASSGPGSPGNETTTFGAATKAAVIKFQEAHAKEILVPIGYEHGTGIVSAKTRAIIADILRAICPALFQPSAPPPAPHVTSTPPLISFSSSTCSRLASLPFPTKNLKWKDVDPQVQFLQVFLNASGFPVAMTGPGSPGNETTFFGESTQAALIRFQEAFRSQILSPAGLEHGTGVTGERTRMVMQDIFTASCPGFSLLATSTPPITPTSTLVCAPISIAALPTKDLKLGDVDPQVKLLQIFLNTSGFPIEKTGPGSLGNETTTFGPGTKEALTKYQNAHPDLILGPQGLKHGTGILDALTRSVMQGK